VQEAVLRWEEWRKGQCDYPSGLSEAEKELMAQAETIRGSRMFHEMARLDERDY